MRMLADGAHDGLIRLRKLAMRDGRFLEPHFFLLGGESFHFLVFHQR